MEISCKNLLVSGHSWTANKDWFTEIMEYEKVTNLSYPGAGNMYIRDSVKEHLVQNQDTDFVFVVWGGLLRLDVALPKAMRPKWHEIETKGETNTAAYYTNSMAPWRDRAVELPIEDPLVRMSYQQKGYQTVKDQSLNAIIDLQDLLQGQGVDYRFAFMYDYTNTDFDHNHLTGESGHDGFSTLGSTETSNPILKHLDGDKCLSPFGLDWALSQPQELMKDAIHLTDQGYRSWAKNLHKSEVDVFGKDAKINKKRS